MIWLMIVVMVLAVAEAHDSTLVAGKIQTLEKQVEVLTNLVLTQSNIMSRFSCSQGASGLNPASECLLKIADQAKNISKLEEELKSLESSVESKESEIRVLKKDLSDLSKLVSAQNTQLTSLDSKYAAEVSKLLSEIKNVKHKTNTLTNSVNQLGSQVQQVKGQWPSGSYCILASGNCPSGFSRRSGYMRAISLYAGNGNYIKQATFGDSKIQCHGSCGQYGHWTGELYVNACCK